MRMLISLSLLLSLSACSKPETRPVLSDKTKPTTRDLQAIQNRDVARTPTLPEAGLIKGKIPALSVEENIARLTRNRISPLTFGEGLAGITMTTTRNDSKTLLSEPTSTSDSGLDYFAEGFAISWNEGLNPTPKSIRIFNDYKGPIKLPAPYGEVTFGQDLSGLLKADPDFTTFTKTLGKAFTGKDDCLAEKSCAISKQLNETFIDFPSGTIVLFHNMISVMDFIPNATFIPKITTPSLPGQSLAGVSLKMNRNEVEALLGTPYHYAFNGRQLYDAKTIQIQFRESGVIERIYLFPGHQGKINIGKLEAAIGSTFAGLTAGQQDPDGILLTIALAKIAGEKSSDYDCTKDQPLECFYRKESGLVYAQYGNTVYAFTDDDKRTLTSLFIFNTAD
ncbi:MAG: hypothetical protein EOP10_25335 [Proteobacteria bacterium]|nr:MAG: hypothetical protein EOP10_25335 [Pseudomonadota bacterium]